MFARILEPYSIVAPVRVCPFMARMENDYLNDEPSCMLRVYNGEQLTNVCLIFVPRIVFTS